MRKRILIISLGITFFFAIALLIQVRLQIIPRIPGLSFKKTYKIRIGCSLLTPINCMFGEVFRHTDILKKNGLEGKISFFAHGGDQSKACQADKIDTTFSCEVPAIFQLMNCPDLIIVGSPGSLGRIALIVLRNSDVFSLQDLKGRKILVLDGCSAMMMARKWFKNCGLDPDHDVKLISSDKDSILNRLFSKEGDAVVSWDPWLEELLEKREFRVINERLFHSVVVVMQRYLRKYPEAVIRYEAALKDAFVWASNNKDTVSGWISTRSGMEEGVVKNVMELNENLVLHNGERRAVSLSLKQTDIKILEECNNYVVKTEKIPLDFDIREKINLEVFHK